MPNVNGLTVNMLEAGAQGRPLALLLHGFPNLGYSWRKVMPPLADAGYYVVAPDCRGFGRTVGWDRSWDADPTPFLTLNMVRDQIALVLALAVLATGLAAAGIVRLLPTLRSQLVALALLAVCLPLGVVLASGLVLRLGPSAEWFVWPIPAIVSPFVALSCTSR